MPLWSKFLNAEKASRRHSQLSIQRATNVSASSAPSIIPLVAVRLKQVEILLVAVKLKQVVEQSSAAQAQT